jgi:hypothetical protein
MTQTVTVNVDLQTDQAQTQGFSTPSILTEDANFTVNRSKSYSSPTDVVADFAVTTKEYKAAAALFTQDPAPATIKFIRQDSGDASMTAALNAIFLEDNAWYDWVILSRVKADILEAAAWAELNKRYFNGCSEDADVYDSADVADVLSTLAGFNYEYTSLQWHHQGGVDSTSGIIGVILSEVVTVDDTGHGLRVNDPITVSAGADAATNGNFIVATVPTDNQFTYVASGAIDDPTPADAIDYFARYTFPESAMIGAVAWREVGSYTRKFKTLTGQQVIPTTVINSSEMQAIQDKGGNIYIEERGLDIYKEGISVGGNFTDNIVGKDWLKDTMEAQVFTQLKNPASVPYNDAGFGLVENQVRDVLAQALARNVITPIDDSTEYILDMPRAATAADVYKSVRAIPPITVTAKIGGSVHSLVVNVTLTQ